MDKAVQQIYPVVIPRLGLTMVEASILEWYRQDGEWVNKGEPLFAIENEKAAVDIEAPASGYLRILVSTGITLPVLTPIAEIHLQPPDTPAAPISPDPASTRPSGSKVKAAGAPNAAAAETPKPVAASPKARRLAEELGVPLSEVSGSGLRGMIISADVQRQAHQFQRRASPLAERIAAEAGLDLSGIQGSGSRGRILRRDVEAALHPSADHFPSSSQPLGGTRAVIARRLTASWQERPQVTLFTEADAVHLLQVRQQLNDELAQSGEKVSLNALFIKICANSLSEHPLLNAYIEGDRIVQPANINIGIAVDTERGLVVPVIHQADQKPLRQINRELKEVIQRALQNRNQPQDLEDGTFSITNLGIYEIDGFTPLLNPPQTAILGIGRIRPKPAEQDGSLILRPQVTLSLSFDHRLVDGAPAARFLQHVKRLIEKPFLWLW